MTALARNRAPIRVPVSRQRTPAFNGADGGAPDMSEVTKLIGEVHANFEAFKAQNDKEIAEIKAGKSDVVTREHTDRINAAVDSVQTQLETINTRMNALAVNGGSNNDGDKRSAERKVYDKAFRTWFRRGEGEQALSGLAIKAALTSDNNPSGGWLVDAEMDAAISRVLTVVSAMRGLATVRSIGTSMLKKLVKTGGASSGWVGEKDARSETNSPTMSELQFPVMELYAEPSATQNLLDDATFDPAIWLADEVAIEFAAQEGSAFINGDGLHKPRGILQYDIVADASYAWGKVGYIASGAAGDFPAASTTVVQSNGLIDTQQALKTAYRNGASWLMNRATQGKVRKLQDLYGNYLWVPGIAPGQSPTVLGDAVSIDDNMPDIAANSYSIAYGNFPRAYLIVDRQGATILRDPYTNKPYVMFYTTKRVGGGIQMFEALKLVKFAAS